MAMAKILSDKNCEGHADAIFRALGKSGYVELLEIEMLYFQDVGLADNATDETVWLLCQRDGFFLLTGNRSREDSLERVSQRLITETSLPVLTVGTLRRVLTDPQYCERCAERIAEIMIDLEKYRGTPRLYIPNSSG